MGSSTVFSPLKKKREKSIAENGMSGVQAGAYKASDPPPSNSAGYRTDKVRRKRLTAQKRKEIKEAFDLFDIDGSGSVMY
jgi:hypothetical protein